MPSILYWKGVLQPSSSEQMIAVQAILPTLLSLSGEGPVSDETDGRSVWSALTGGALSPNPLEEYLDNFPRGENVAVPYQDIVNDSDFSGGEEDRAPWSEIASD